MVNRSRDGDELLGFSGDSDNESNGSRKRKGSDKIKNFLKKYDAPAANGTDSMQWVITPTRDENLANKNDGTRRFRPDSQPLFNSKTVDEPENTFREAGTFRASTH